MEVYLIFTDTKTSMGKLIKRLTNHPYSHVSISFNQDLSEVYSFGRKNPDNPFGGGFVKEDFRNQFFRRALCSVYSCTVTEKEYDMMKAYVNDVEVNQDKYKYNFLGLFGVLFEQPIEKDYSYFCSQFVALVLKSGGRMKLNKPASLISPKDISSSKDLVLSYSGELMSYPFLNEKMEKKETHQMMGCL